MSARRFCTKRVTILRRTKTGPATYTGHDDHLTNVAMTPLWPTNTDEIIDLLGHDPTEMRECYHVPLPGDPLPDIKRGDRIEYPGEPDRAIAFVQPWEDESGDDIGSMRLIVHIKEPEKDT